VFAEHLLHQCDLVGDDRRAGALGELLDQVAEEQVFVRPVPVRRAARHVGVADDVLEPDVIQAYRQPAPVDHLNGRLQHPVARLLIRAAASPAAEAGRSRRIFSHTSNLTSELETLYLKSMIVHHRQE
jgi:hypothetical protein